MNGTIVHPTTESSKTAAQLRTENATFANICAADKRRQERRDAMEAKGKAEDPNWTWETGVWWAV